ncbi:MAG: HAD family hydrolase [archaeon]
MQKAILFDFDSTLTRLYCDWDSLKLKLQKQLPEIDTRLGNFEYFTQVHKKYHSMPKNRSMTIARMITMAENQALKKAKLFTEVRPVLKSLKNDYKFAIVSGNSETTIKKALRKFRLDSYIKVVSGMQAGLPKPNPDALLRAMEKLKVSSENVVYIGDRPTDILAAQKANIKAIGVITGKFNMHTLLNCGALSVIENLSFLPETLERVFDGKK